ncbi:MAG: TVP38/TMEM64 family protein [Spirochaetia bacterium]|jgi:uncharacterized membrane protein YdjX (TVP38/TMEM64 family)
MQKPLQKRVIALAAFPLLVAAVVVPVIIWHNDLWKIFASVRRVRTWIDGWGPGAPFVFMAVQAVQVIVFALPGEVVQIAGGYLFGGWLGTLLSLSGILIGSAIAFFLARLLGKPFLAAVIPREQLERVEKLLASPSSKVVFFLLFLIPGIPKDILCYVAGISPLRFPFFIAASALGRLPGIIGSSIIGRAAAAQRWVLLGIVSLAALLLFVAGFILRPRIQAWMEKVAAKRRPP